jgi:glycosyltransferase involved in cell wall biosynthesis
MRILALTRYERLGSSSRVRFYQYFPYLSSRGMEVVNAPFFENSYVTSLYNRSRISTKLVLTAYARRISSLLRKGSFDLLWVEKELLPWFPASIEALFRTREIPYVVDYDDAVFHRYDLHPLPLVRTLLGRKIDDVMRNAALVVVGNEYLADHADRAGARRVEVLPSVVDVSSYHVRRHEKSRLFTIGWIGSPVTAKHLHLVRRAVDQLGQESNVRVLLVGAGNEAPFPGIHTETPPWSEEFERTLSREIDVGIMPLVDGPFERGKCGYKLVQYMAGGIPVVASPVGINQKIVEHLGNGYLAASTQEWLMALRSLRDDIELRAAMGQAGHQKAKKLYNLHVTAPRLFDLLSAAASSS